MSQLTCRKLIIISAVLILLIALATATLAEDGDDKSSHITFLRLRLDSTGVSLVNATTVPGKLKTPRQNPPQREYSYEVVGADSAIQFRGTFDNPLVRRLEYEDPDNPGQIRTKVVELPTAEVTVRVPFRPDMHHLDIYRNTLAAARGGRPDYKLVRSIPLDGVVTGEDK